MYWGIPPEINAFRLTMMGAGPTAHIPQITAYTIAAATHMEQATQQTVTAGATAPLFEGLGGVGMLGSATPMSAWLATAGAHAEAAATTIQTGMTAYSTASAATVPYPVVVANRLREAALESTNLLGQNTIPIAETNAEYGEFWSQNAAAMMGYLATVTPLISALSVPLEPLPNVSNPAPALAGVARVGVSAGVEGIGAGSGAVGQGVSSAGQAGSGLAADAAGGVQGLGAGIETVGQGALSSAGGAGSILAAGASVSAGVGGAQAATSGAPAAQGSPGAGQNGEPPLLQSGQALLGQITEAPSALMSALGSPLSSLGQIPSTAGGQLSGLMGPLSALTGGMASGMRGGPGGALGAPELSVAKAPWSGLSGANGGFAGGGSAVSAALTKPSASGLGGPVGLPGGWWAGVADHAEAAEQRAAGLRGGAPVGSGATGPGVYGPMAAAARSGRGAEHADVAEPDKAIMVAGTAHGAPVLTSAGVIHVGQGG